MAVKLALNFLDIGNRDGGSVNIAAAATAAATIAVSIADK